MGLLEYLGFKRREEIPQTSRLSEDDQWLDDFTERHNRLMRRQARYQAALNDFPHSHDQVEYVYLQPQIMKAILRDCVSQRSS